MFDIKEAENGLKTVGNIPIVAVGEEWEASTGPATVTKEDLQAAVDALADPSIKLPRIKLGHLDPRFTPDNGNIFDGTPVLGKFDNLQIGDDGMTLYADAIGVPEWFANIMPYAYPNRSVDAWWGVKTKTGQTHQFVVSAVCLLGDEYPAIETLDDLQTMFSKEGPDWVKDFEEGRQMVAASKGGSAMPNRRIAASVSVEDIRRSFFDDFATIESGRWDWWTRAVYVDPNLVVAADFDDNLFAVTYTITDDDKVEWGDPVEVFTQYVETESGKVAAAKVLADKTAVAAFSKSDGARPKNDKKETRMSINIGALRTRLGLTAEQLPDDATEDQINEALANAPASPDSAKTGNPEQPLTDDEQEPNPEAGAPTPGEPSEGGSEERGTAGPGTTGEPGASQGEFSRIDPEALKQLQADAKAGRAAREEQVKARRTTVVRAAITDGKIPKAREGHYLSLMERDEEGTTQLLASLEKGVIPVDQEKGHGDPNPGDDSAYDESWLTPGERSRISAAKAGSQPPRVVSEA